MTLCGRFKVPGTEQVRVKLSKPPTLQVIGKLSSVTPPRTMVVGKFLNLLALFLSLRKMQHISLGVKGLLRGCGAEDRQLQ